MQKGGVNADRNVGHKPTWDVKFLAWNRRLSTVAAMNRTDRLVAMVMYMQGRRVVRAEELARNFEVTVRTIYRDIAALGEAGVPVTGEAGVGYTLVKSYHLPPVMLTADEAAALFVGGEIVKRFTDASLHQPMGTALDKLRAVLPRERQDHVERLSRHTIVMERGCGDSAQEAQPWLMPLPRAVMQRRVVRLGYRGKARAEETTRDVEPLGVVFYGGGWFLVGWCRLRGDYRHFRVDRIRTLVTCEETFPVREDFSLTKHLEEGRKKMDTIPARIWLATGAQEKARRESYGTLVKENVRDEGAEFSLFTYSLDWLAGWILSFGGEAEALEPAELRDKVKTKIAALAGRHRMEEVEEWTGATPV
jgi:predicted DNA-binding transcriptional regulator YafY